MPKMISGGRPNLSQEPGNRARTRWGGQLHGPTFGRLGALQTTYVFNRVESAQARPGISRTAVRFRYRFVPYGTAFLAAQGSRGAIGGESAPGGLLYENEIAADVGVQTWGFAGCDIPVIDHHFLRDDGGQFPSASAAVLHLAADISERFSSIRTENDGDVIWLVTHTSPDFDSLCALFLIRHILSIGSPWADGTQFGIRPRCWLPTDSGKRISWFNPLDFLFEADSSKDRTRGLILLASAASCVENGRHLAVPRNRALHSVFYAAIARGRRFESLDDGGFELFHEALSRIIALRLNPLVDSVFDTSDRFAPELALLDRESEAYARDLRRAGRGVVNVQRSQVPLVEFYRSLTSQPLLDSDGNLFPSSAPQRDQMYAQLDAIYLRDPESVLFKEWARLDVDHSPLKRGFQFTAVAYSSGRPQAAINSTDYYFALDPDKSFGCHLYGVWARLQAAEARALRARGDIPTTIPREGFEERATAEWAAEFSDPWFDSPNYGCTIVATPSRGTVIGSAGTAADLSDDPVFAIVRETLDATIYDSDVTITDMLAMVGHADSFEMDRTFTTREAVGVEPLPGHFRFVSVHLHDSVACNVAEVADHVADFLWTVLMPDGQPGVPALSRPRHQVTSSEFIAVWNERGIGIAYRATASRLARQVRFDIAEIATLSSRVAEITNGPSVNTLYADETFELLRRAVRLQHHLALPEGRLVRPFCDAVRIGDLLTLITSLHADAINRGQLKELQGTLESQRETQTAIEWLEVVILTVYCTELVELLLRSLTSSTPDYWEFSALLTVGIAAFGLTTWHLRPWKHGQKGEGVVVPILLLVAVLMAVGGVALHHRSNVPNPSAQPTNPDRSTRSGARHENSQAPMANHQASPSLRPPPSPERPAEKLDKHLRRR